MEKFIYVFPVIKKHRLQSSLSDPLLSNCWEVTHLLWTSVIRDLSRSSYPSFFSDCISIYEWVIPLFSMFLLLFLFFCSIKNFSFFLTIHYKSQRFFSSISDFRWLLWDHLSLRSPRDSRDGSKVVRLQTSAPHIPHHPSTLHFSQVHTLIETREPEKRVHLHSLPITPTLNFHSRISPPNFSSDVSVFWSLPLTIFPPLGSKSSRPPTPPSLSYGCP